MTTFIKSLHQPFIIALLVAFFAGTGCSRKNSYISKAEFETDLKKHQALTPETVAQLRKFGVTEQTELKLEFFFYTNSQSNANKLKKTLEKRGYDDVTADKSTADEEKFLIKGWTNRIKMDEQTVVQWTEEMCRTGFKHDCKFDGWGTNPKQ